MSLKEKIENITSEYFKDKIDYLNLLNASKELKFLLEEIANQNINTDAGRVDVSSDNGKALGTFWAVLCIDDIIRTRQFLRGIDKAIKEKIDTNKPLHILYAGTGPFATLILPFIAKYRAEDIKYTLLELNSFTFKILQNVISQLEVQDYDITLIQSDATKFKLDVNHQPDIVISETMQNGLAKEQQVPIFLNLMHQAKKDVIFIPEKIELYIGLKKAGIPIDKINETHFTKIEKVLEISKQEIFSKNQLINDEIKNYSFKGKRTFIENKAIDGYNQLVLMTEIQVYNNEKISINQSGLTLPIIMKDFSNDFKKSLIVDTNYIISSEPKLEYKITEQ